MNAATEIPRDSLSPANIAFASSLRARQLLVPTLLLLLFAAQCGWFIATQSFTLDEPGHIAAGLAMWKYGRFVMNNDQPPLARKLAAAPLRFLTDADVDNTKGAVIGIQPRYATYARLPMVPLGILLGALLWWALAALFSFSAANFGLTLFSLSPPLIAHFSIAGTDGAGTLAVFVGTVTLALWLRRPTWRSTLISGVVMGLTLLSKFYTAPLAAVWLAMMAIQAYRSRLARGWLHIAVAVVLAWGVVAVGYNLHIARFRFSNGTMTAHFQHRENDWVAAVPFQNSFTVYVPAGDYIDGLAYVYRHNQLGHGGAYLFGKLSGAEGIRSYHLWVILLKWPLMVLLLSLVGANLLARRKLRLPSHVWMAATLPLFFFASALFSRIQIGDRHILPLYPFLIVLAAAVWEHLRHSRIGSTVLLACLFLNGADVARYAPDYLSYFDPAIPPTQTWQYLGDSNTDWGQGILALKHYQDAHPGERLFVRAFADTDPRLYGVHFETFGEADHPRGTVIVSVNDMAGYYLKDHTAFHWLWQHPLKADLNHTLLVFNVE